MYNGVFLLFGATGDLAFKKLLPAFYFLDIQNKLENCFYIVCIGRKKYSNEEYCNLIKSKFEEDNVDFCDSDFNRFKNRIYYFNLNFENINDYFKLKNFIESSSLDLCTQNNLIYYLATPPKYFKVIPILLKKSKLNSISKTKKIIIEKPFGKDLNSAKMYNTIINEEFSEKEIFRIDHYLGKQMIQNIMILRFTNPIFENILNSKFVDNIQIHVSESVGVLTRGNYYEHSGALKDMVQNHILQIISLICMDEPLSLSTKDIRDQKLKILQDIKLYNENNPLKNIVIGQYDESKKHISYVDEYNVDNNSLTETFVSLKLKVQNKRWQNTPIYIRTGKGLDKKYANVIIELKNNNRLYNISKSNIFVIQIQPKEGMSLEFNTKIPSTQINIEKQHMEFCQNCNIKDRSPQAYEKLLLDALNNDQSLYTRWDEIESEWSFIDNISNLLDFDYRKKYLQKYEFGSLGPEKSFLLIENDNKKWLFK
ncbi:glucose-6-phosphate dehydrogenase [Peptostreptococcaceae bacterium AGR-M142]